MTSKERVQAAIARKPVDRVPLGFYAVDCDTVARVIGRPTYVRNKIAIHVALWEGRRDEVAESLKKDTVEFYRKLDCADIILPKEAPVIPPKSYVPPLMKKLSETEWQDPKGSVFRASPMTNEIQIVYTPPEPPREYTVEEFEKPLEFKEPDPSVFEVFDYVYDHLGGERYICAPAHATAMTLLGGTENGLLMYAMQPDVVMAASRQACAAQNASDSSRIRKGAPGALIEQDLAGTNAPLLSPKMFREMCLPFLTERVRRIKQFVPQVVLHNCGNNFALMEMLIEAGIDGYQSLQTTAGMEIGKLKRMYGGNLCFWGGVPVELLVAGTPDEVRKATRQAMEAGAPGGGFILGPSHSIAYGTKYENFMAMVDEFVRLRNKVY